MRLLDLFCGAGGAAMGYSQAGFTEIVGVDIVPQPNYPFTFIQGDVLAPPVELGGFDLIHASPPCQGFSAMRHIQGKEHVDLLTPTLVRLANQKIPYVIENVLGAPLASQATLFGTNAMTLCGSTFGLGVKRHRLFQTSFPVVLSPCGRHSGLINFYAAVSRKRSGVQFNRRRHFGRAMDIDWMTNEHEISEAIPPAYTKYIGEQFLAQL